MISNQIKIKPLIGGAALIASGILLLIRQSFDGYDLQDAIFSCIFIGVCMSLFAYALLSGMMPLSAMMMTGLQSLYQIITQHWEPLAYSWIIILIVTSLGIFITEIHRVHWSQPRNELSLLGASTVVFIGFSAFFANIFNFFSLVTFTSSTTLILLGACLIAVGVNLRSQSSRTNENPTEQMAMKDRGSVIL